MKGTFYNPNTGKQVSGAAAQQMIIKHDGGWEAHHQKFADAIVQEMASSYLNQLEQEFRQTAIRRVK